LAFALATHSSSLCRIISVRLALKKPSAFHLQMTLASAMSNVGATADPGSCPAQRFGVIFASAKQIDSLSQ
jgi:hypothetical protein